MTPNETRLVAALNAMLEVQRVLMPGVRYISVPDYSILNDAPIEARKAIAAVSVKPKIHWHTSCPSCTCPEPP